MWVEGNGIGDATLCLVAVSDYVGLELWEGGEAQSRHSARPFLQSSELVLPTPSPAGESVPLPLWFRRGGHIRWRGGPNWYSRYSICVLCGARINVSNGVCGSKGVV